MVGIGSWHGPLRSGFVLASHFVRTTTTLALLALFIIFSQPSFWKNRENNLRVFVLGISTIRSEITPMLNLGFKSIFVRIGWPVS